MNHFKLRWWYFLLLLPLILTGAFILWALTPSGPMPEALLALESTENVRVSNGDWLVFSPQNWKPDTGLIIYPGGRIDPRSYAPQAHAIAESGHMVVIAPMPLNLAVFGADKARDIMAAFPEIENWAVGGHSLGGAMAARFTLENPEAVDGLVLWAAYPAQSDDLTGYDLEVSSISASNDGLATPAEIRASSALLPEGTHWIEIAGGNHAQFGWYGPQRGDKVPAISRQEQQEQIVQATVMLLSAIQNLDR